MDEEIILASFKEEKYSKTFCKLYENREYFPILKQMNKCEILLIQYFALTAEAKSNMVRTDKRALEGFLNLFGEESYSYGTVKTAIKRLKEWEMLIPLKRRGAAVVNPKYFYAESESIRYRLIQEIKRSQSQELKIQTLDE